MRLIMIVFTTNFANLISQEIALSDTGICDATRQEIQTIEVKSIGLYHFLSRPTKVF